MFEATLIRSFEATYLALNSVVDREDSTIYPIEFLISFNASGLLTHEIKLKSCCANKEFKSANMRNLNRLKLCRLRVKYLQRHVIEVTMLTEFVYLRFQLTSYSR